MSSEEISLVSSQNGLNSPLVFQDQPLRFNNCRDHPGPKTRELAGFIDDKLFSAAPTSAAAAAAGRFFPSHRGPDFSSSTVYRGDPQHHRPRNWNANGHRTSSDEDDEEEEDDDDGDIDDEDDDVDGGDGHASNGVGTLAAVDNNGTDNISCNKNRPGSFNSNINATISATDNAASSICGNLDKLGNGKAKHHSPFVGSSGEVMVLKDGGTSVGQNPSNAVVTIAEPDGDLYYSQYLQATEGSGVGRKDMNMSVDNGCGFSGRKEVSSLSSDSGDSLRAILSDPVTGALMDDAMILPCGHSFGGGGIQHVLRLKACYTCSQSIAEDLISPNLSLRAAVQAFRREEELHFYRSPKRRRDRFDQDRVSYGDSTVMDLPKGRGVQFPFAVTDRVIIKGNKRTPTRFVGREAVVTTQCLNGWYVVKTLDNAESVKLQYRSLAKVSDDQPSNAMPSKMAPNWL